MPASRSSLVKKAKNIRLVAMDVDGVLTGGEIVVLESGEEVKFWNAKDRLLLALIDRKKIPLTMAWITGRSSKAVEAAAEDLGVSHVVQGCSDKYSALEKIIKKHKLAPSQVAFIGDDLIDLPALKRVGFSACPSDATTDVKQHALYHSPFPGGKGVVRDVLEFILRAQKKWTSIVNPFLS